MEITSEQLEKIKKFANNHCQNTGKYHGWNHITKVTKLALKIAEKDQDIDKNALKAACYLHDIGRIIQDKGHAEESAKLSRPFLKRIGISKDKMEIIIDAIRSHDIKEILDSKTIEARYLFDADKLEILSVSGFLRIISWLADERNMTIQDAINLYENFSSKVQNGLLYSNYAKSIAEEHGKIIQSYISVIDSWEKNIGKL